MKVLLINGSPHEHGCTDTALREVAQTLEQAGIQLYGGVQGSADDAVQAFIDGKLEYNPDVMCSHHDHGEGHSCGEHGHNCGNGGCH